MPRSPREPEPPADRRSGGLRAPGRTGDVVARSGRGTRQRDELDDLPSPDDIERFGDVTQTCPECGKEVFDDSEVCYHCGHAISTSAAGVRSPRWVIVTVIVIVGAFTLALLLRVF